MDPSEMSTSELTNKVAKLAVLIDENDLDLVSSGKRLSRQLSVFRTELLSRMKGEDNPENRETLQSLMNSAVQANSDGLAASYEACLAQQQVILAEASKEQPQGLTAASIE